MPPQEGPYAPELANPVHFVAFISCCHAGDDLMACNYPFGLVQAVALGHGSRSNPEGSGVRPAPATLLVRPPVSLAQSTNVSVGLELGVIGRSAWRLVSRPGAKID